MSIADSWLQLVLRDLEDYSKFRDPKPDYGESVPPWVVEISKKLDRLLFPLRADANEVLKPRKVGALLGQTYAYFGWLLDCMRRPNRAVQDRFKRSAKEFLEEDFDESFAASLRGTFELGIVLGFTRFQHVVKRAFLAKHLVG